MNNYLQHQIKRCITTIIIFITVSYASNSIKKDNDSSVFIELGGQGTMLSINYETRLFNDSFKLRTGIGAVAVYLTTFNTLPISVNYLFDNNFEAGLGITPWIYHKSSWVNIDYERSKIFPNAWLGYRYQKNEKYLLKFGITIVAKNYDKYFPFPGLAIGILF